MKRYQYIIFSIFLSSLIVYLSVGMPLVRYNCTKCAHNSTQKSIVSIVEINSDGTSCHCSSHEKCACGKQKAHHQNGEEKDNGGCSKVNILKINLPVLTSSIHLDNVVCPVIDLSVFNYCANLSELYNNKIDNPFIEDTGPILRPREYINTICTLII